MCSSQVSYDEFYKLAKHPDPSRPDFNSQFDGVETKAKVTGSMFPGGAPPPPPKGTTPPVVYRALVHRMLWYIVCCGTSRGAVPLHVLTALASDCWFGCNCVL